MGLSDDVLENEKVVCSGRKSIIGIFLSFIWVSILFYYSYIILFQKLYETIDEIKENWVNIFIYLYFVCLIIGALYAIIDSFLTNIIVTETRVYIKKLFRRNKYDMEEIDDIVPIKVIFYSYIIVKLKNKKSININNLSQRSFREVIKAYNR
jgi:hypothetical protein